jgi:hypothetical protein
MREDVSAVADCPSWQAHGKRLHGVLSRLLLRYWCTSSRCTAARNDYISASERRAIQGPKRQSENGRTVTTWSSWQAHGKRLHGVLSRLLLRYWCTSSRISQHPSGCERKPRARQRETTIYLLRSGARFKVPRDRARTGVTTVSAVADCPSWQAHGKRLHGVLSRLLLRYWCTRLYICFGAARDSRSQETEREREDCYNMVPLGC